MFEGKKHFFKKFFFVKSLTFSLLRPYYIAKRTREILISNIHLLSPQKGSQFVHFDIEKVFLRGQPWTGPGFLITSKINSKPL